MTIAYPELLLRWAKNNNNKKMWMSSATVFLAVSEWPESYYSIIMINRHYKLYMWTVMTQCWLYRQTGQPGHLLFTQTTSSLLLWHAQIITWLKSIWYNILLAMNLNWYWFLIWSHVSTWSIKLMSMTPVRFVSIDSIWIPNNINSTVSLFADDCVLYRTRQSAQWGTYTPD